MTLVDLDLTRRIVERTAVTASGCWEWDHAAEDGYGRIRVGGRALVAHRAAYETFVGPVPDGLDLDHLCRNRLCVNPRHLEPVTRSENLRRGDVGGRYELGGVCRNGHALTPDTLMVKPGGGHRCRTCRRAVTARYEEKRRAAAA